MGEGYVIFSAQPWQMQLNSYTVAVVHHIREPFCTSD